MICLDSAAFALLCIGIFFCLRLRLSVFLLLPSYNALSAFAPKIVCAWERACRGECVQLFLQAAGCCIPHLMWQWLLHKDCKKLFPLFSKLWCWKFRCSGNIISSSLNHLLRRCCMDAVLSCCEESICASQVSLNILLVQPAYTRSVLYLFDLSRLYLSYTLTGKPFPGNLLMPSSASSQPSSSHLICPVDSAFAPKKLLAVTITSWENCVQIFPCVTG